jgi:hypothetical protein
MYRSRFRQVTLSRFVWLISLLFGVLMLVPTSLASAACPALPTANGTASFTVNVPADGDYRFWAHVYSPSAKNDGFYLQVDDANCQIVVGDSPSITTGKFTWVDYQGGTSTNKIDIKLSAGKHTVTLAGLDPGVGIDKVMFLTDVKCAPGGNGNNCAATAEPSATAGPAAPDSGASSGGTNSGEPSGPGLPLRDGSRQITEVSTVKKAVLWALVAIFTLLVVAVSVLWRWRRDVIYKLLDRIRGLLPKKKQFNSAAKLDGPLPVVFVSSNRFTRMRRLPLIAAGLGFLVVCGAGLLVIRSIAASPSAALLLSDKGVKLSGKVVLASYKDAIGGKMVQFGVNPPASSGGGPATPAPAPAAPPAFGLNLPRVPWEGGPAYYAGFSKAAAWNNAAFFPIGVWFEGVYGQAEINLDKGAGLNTYIELTGGSNLPLVRSNGMYAVLSELLPNYGSETVGWLLSDEVDMWAGPGSSPWTGNYPGQGNICTPSNASCGYTVLQTLLNGLPANDGRMKYANFGKGTMFWESDAEASKFVNNYTHFNSNDIYWYTDANVCYNAEGPTLVQGSGPISQYTGLHDLTQAECRRSSNYGTVMERMRALDAMDGKRQPIFAFVEDGHPSDDSAGALTINGNQLAGAVFNSLIHEARGVIYFNHNFGGPCQSQHVLRDCGLTTIRPKVTETNQRVKDLAGVLNTQSYQYSFGGNLDTMLKAYNGSYYIFAMQKYPNNSGSYTFTLPPGMGGSTVEALYEGRNIPISGGKFTDSFAAEYSYHVYKITP